MVYLNSGNKTFKENFGVPIMKILVTVSLGLIGSHLVVSLQVSIHDVYIIDYLANAKMDLHHTLKTL